MKLRWYPEGVLRISALMLVACLAGAQPAPLLDVMRTELDRNFQILKQKADPAPYFLQYSVVEQRTRVWSATLGALLTDGALHNRVLDVSVRTGSREFDNYRVVGGERPRFASATALPLEDKPDEIRRRLWLETDRTWRRAAQRLTNLKTRTQLNVAASDTSADFSAEAPTTALLAPPAASSADAGWADRVRRWSAGFKKFPDLVSSGVTIQIQQETKYLANTEGTGVRHGRGFARIVMSARGKAADGMDVYTTGSFEAEQAAGLPSDTAVLSEVERVGREVQGLLKAPVVDPFVGPAILSGRAAAVFFHEIFGHRIEGHRQKDETEGQTFTKMVGSSVLPAFLSVAFDPTRKQVDGVDLNGTYAFDDEGVKARPVTVVDKGVLKTFLMSRTPVQGFPTSNGHGRKQPGLEVVSRQSNLIVTSSNQVSEARLREMLVAEIKRQNKPYGFYFEQVTGGFTTTGRRGLQAYTVIPLVVYRVYPDGRPDQLVRGVDIVGTPLSSFARIMATSDKVEVFNGYCGAESGSVPVSAVSPALLVSEIEIQKKDKGQDRPPILPAPVATVTGGAW